MESLKNHNCKHRDSLGSPDFWIHAILFLSGFSALFFLLTNGIPLVQAGWIHELGKKSRYVRFMWISVSVFSTLMFLAWWKFRTIFDGSFWVKLWRALCRIPLRYMVTGFFVAYAAMMAWVGFERQLALETRAFDLGIFAQAVWNTLQGDFLFSSIKENINLMGDHVSPILLGAVPLYAIWPDPRMLVLFQAIACASCFFPLALIARDKLKDRSLVLIFLLMFFFFQPMRAALHEDFHPEVLAEPFLWWAFLFLEKKQIKWFVLSLLIAVTGKENFLGIAFMFGFYAFVWKRMRVLGIFLMLGAAGLLIWETKWLIPHLTGSAYFYGGNYSRMLADPIHEILLKLLSLESLEYILKIFLPFLFLPFFHIAALVLTFPVLLQNLLSANGAMRSFNYHYLTGMTPFLFISTIYALARLRNQNAWIRNNLTWIGFGLLLCGTLRSGPSEYWFFWNTHSHRNAHSEMIREKLGSIPCNARVLTHNNFIPQLCNRKYVYQFNHNLNPTKLDFTKKYAADIVIWDQNYWEPNTEPLESSLKQLQSAGFWVEFERDGFFILRRS
jgi:uncharacterized membrane protein